ncbi:hypothetical protein TH19_06950 [Thalassospira profundimaris]|uniref:Uncharacterized protein n=1 Tax=Thalassospira profundimaris TaxID=502049 RepID=A0A367WB64_9PROT|nr:hypothetical protein TH19_06950 [Thalassospira profundimaris]
MRMGAVEARDADYLRADKLRGQPELRVKSASLWNGDFPFRTWAMMVCLFSVGGFGRHLRPKKPYTVVALSKSYRVPVSRTTTGTCDFGQAGIYACCFSRASEIFIPFVMKQSQDRRITDTATQKMAQKAVFLICKNMSSRILVWGIAICAYPGARVAFHVRSETDAQGAGWMNRGRVVRALREWFHMCES